MATLTHLLNQTCTIATEGAVDKFGKHTFGTATSYNCRFESTTRTLATPQNEIEPIDGIVFLDSDATVAIGDKLVFDSTNYRVMKISPIVDGAGLTRHYELLVQRWNT